MVPTPGVSTTLLTGDPSTCLQSSSQISPMEPTQKRSVVAGSRLETSYLALSETIQVILGVVICSVHSEDTVPFTFIMSDGRGDCIVVTLYNLSPGKGVIIGDTVAVPEPFFTAIDLDWAGAKYQFSLVRVESPLVLVINSRKAARELQAGVQMSTFTKTD